MDAIKSNLYTDTPCMDRVAHEKCSPQQADSNTIPKHEATDEKWKLEQFMENIFTDIIIDILLYQLFQDNIVFKILCYGSSIQLQSEVQIVFLVDYKNIFRSIIFNRIQ